MIPTSTYILHTRITMPSNLSTAEQQAESYYDSSDADHFYEKVWGGEDIHIGLYQTTTNIPQASRLTVRAMAESLQSLKPQSRVIDLGAGYGGSGRYLTSLSDCHVTCLNISEVQNERNRLLNKEQGLSEKINVLHGSFEDIPCEDRSMDIVWSQDSFLHSNRREQILDEIERILTSGGELIFTDPMQADECPDGVLQPVYDRLNLDSMGSIGWYRQQLEKRGFTAVNVVEMTEQLRNHYANVKKELESRYDEMLSDIGISQVYVDRMIMGLQHWVDAADKGYLAWGILHFRKNN